MDEEQNLRKNKNFIRFVLRAENSTDIRAFNAKRILVERRFIHYAETYYRLSMDDGIQAFNRALAQVAEDLRLGRISLTDVNLEEHTLRHGKGFMYEQVYLQNSGPMF
jgi:hypothetical protein